MAFAAHPGDWADCPTADQAYTPHLQQGAEDLKPSRGVDSPGTRQNRPRVTGCSIAPSGQLPRSRSPDRGRPLQITHWPLSSSRLWKNTPIPPNTAKYVAITVAPIAGPNTSTKVSTRADDGSSGMFLTASQWALCEVGRCRQFRASPRTSPITDYTKYAAMHHVAPATHISGCPGTAAPRSQPRVPRASAVPCASTPAKQAFICRERAMRCACRALSSPQRFLSGVPRAANRGPVGVPEYPQM